MEEARLLQEAIQEYTASLHIIWEALAASPSEEELLDLKGQLEAALRDAEESLHGLQAATPSEPPPALAAGTTEQEQEQATSGSPQPKPAAEAALTVLPRDAAGPSNNARIHPRSKYAFEAPNFEALAARYPSLQPFLLRSGGSKQAAGAEDHTTAEGAGGSGGGGRASIDFTNPAACRELTRVLLAADFGVEWWLPLGQLVPPLTNRANYIHWLEDLLALSAPPGPVAGLDIGCGANLIYPLLGASVCGWRFVGADVTAVALAWAARNLGANPQLAPLIELRRVAMQPEQQALWHDTSSFGGSSNGATKQQEQEAAAVTDLAGAPPALAAAEPAAVVQLPAAKAAGSGIVSGAVRRGERFAFCMCNPPFFESIEAAGRNPATAFGGTADEMVYPGGELAFVSGMVQDSLCLRGTVHWYTTMVGKKATLKAVRSLLYRHGVRVLRTTEFFQGKTSRWALAWSFTADASAATQPLARFPGPGNQASAATQPQQQQQSSRRAGASKQQQQQRQPQGQQQSQRQQPGAAAARPVGRKVSWQVHAPPSAAGALLEAAQGCLQQAGLQCTVNAAAYSIRASYLPLAQDLVAAEEAEDLAGVDSSGKRRRAGDTEGGSNGDSASTVQQQGPWELELTLFMQHPGLFLLTAALRKSTANRAQGWFGVQARNLHQALSAQWQVQA